MSRRGGRGTFLRITTSEEEFKRIQALADGVGLPVSTFVRLIVLGAADRGGGTVDQLLRRGQDVSDTVIRRSPEVSRTWENMREGLWASGEWRLSKARPRDGKNREDRTNWWMLYHLDHPDRQIPTAFSKDEALRVADPIIQQEEAHGRTRQLGDHHRQPDRHP